MPDYPALLSDVLDGLLAMTEEKAALNSAVSPWVLHLATHGFFLSDQDVVQTNEAGRSVLSCHLTVRKYLDEDLGNPLLRCGIALAGANRGLQSTNVLLEDGLLTGLEASLLNL